MGSETASARTSGRAVRAGGGRAALLATYRDMLLIRRFEEAAARVYTEGKIGGFCHLYIGQEAIAVGVRQALDHEGGRRSAGDLVHEVSKLPVPVLAT